MKRILFVCLGNICRSPLAEGVFKDLVIKSGFKDDIFCDSCGTAGYHIGCLPDTRSIITAANHGIKLEHKGRKLSNEDFQEFDFIIAMDEYNYNDILTLKRQSEGEAKILMFRDFDPMGKGDVPDPYRGSMEDFEDVYEICLRTSKNLLDFINKSQN